VIGLAALAAAAFAGGAYAATQSSGPSTRQAFLNDVAKRLHVTPQQLTAALDGASADQLQAAVKAGKLTQSQANSLEQRLKQKGAPGAVPFGFFGPGKGGGPAPGPGPGFGPRLRGFGFGGPGPAGGPGGPGLAGELGSAASYLGLTGAQLLKKLSSGQSLAQLAAAQHKSTSGLEQAMTASIKAKLDKLVSAKAITSAREQQILSQWQKRLAQEINQKGFQLPRFGRPALRLHGAMPAPPKTPNGSLGPAAQLFAPPGPSA